MSLAIQVLRVACFGCNVFSLPGIGRMASAFLFLGLLLVVAWSKGSTANASREVMKPIVVPFIEEFELRFPRPTTFVLLEMEVVENPI